MRWRGMVLAGAATAVLAGAATARAAFVTEGGPYKVGTDPLNLNVADFNGDGRPDVATVNGTSSDLSVFLRQPGGGFAQEGAAIPTHPGAASGPSNAAVGDFDGNGLLDLAVANFVSGSVAVLLRQPGGGFAMENGQPISLGTRVDAIATGDFGGDGRLDLVLSRYDQNGTTLLLRNAQNNGFTSSGGNPTGGQPGPIAIADFNGDGLADQAVIDNGGVTVLLRAAGGGFAAESPVAPGFRPYGIAAADFNGDGRPDVAMTNFAGGTVSIFLRRATNDGFSEEAGSPVTVSAQPAGLTAADLDGDGRPDLAVAANSGAIDILTRNPGGGFTRGAIPLAGAQNAVATGDFDGDHRPDLAAVEFTNDTFSALLNPAPPVPPAPTPAPTPLPAPVAGKTVNVTPVSGTVRFKRPGAKRYVTLTAGAQIPVGSSIDTRGGRVALTVAAGQGKTATADFFSGLFKLTQTRGKKPLTTLTLTERLTCPRAKKATAAKKPKRTRRLWGDGTGAFRTSGRYSAATVRGTRWLTQDTCTSTLTRVVRGVVSVRDKVKRRTVTLRAGKRYVAHRRG